jgi:glucose/arabinose dehydrogenase
MASVNGDRYAGWMGSVFVASLKFGFLSRLTLEGERVVSEERFALHPMARLRNIVAGPDGYLYVLTDEKAGKVLRVLGVT